MMNTEALKAIIRTTLMQHHVTADQLLALLNTSDGVRALKLGKPRLLQILRAMEGKGQIEKSYNPVRYHMPVERYTFAPEPSDHGMRVLRSDVDCAGSIIGTGMTETEARVCVTALNELDRRVRAFKTKAR